MISYCPDVNVWLALMDDKHPHHLAATSWLGAVAGSSRMIFMRFTQLGLLRLLTNSSVMEDRVCSLGEAWSAYKQWLDDPRVDFYTEPEDVEEAFREAIAPHLAKPASKAVGDCYLLAFARQSDATLVTFDKALFDLARKNRCDALIPS